MKPATRGGAFLALCIGCLYPSPLFTQPDTSSTSERSTFYQLGGYVKYLFSNSGIPSVGRVNDHLLHSRINGKVFFSEEVRLTAELRNRFFYGGSVEDIPDFLSTVRADHDLPNADIVWWNTRSSVGYSELDRLWVDATYGKFQVGLGRQRIAWGTALVWNPTDLFNPLSVLDFDYEERPGVDAVHLQYYSSAVTKVELAVKPGKTRARSVVAGKVLLNHWNYDIHVLGGTQGGSPFLGGAWAGDIAGAGFRGEVISKKINDATVDLFPFLKNAWSTSLALSADYTFPSNTYIHTEMLFNDRGASGSSLASAVLSQSLGMLSPARWSLFQELSFDVHPLVRVSGFVIYDLDDRSSAIVPSVTWSAVENVDVSFFGLFFSGGTLTQYGNYERSVFLRVKWSY